MNNLDLIIGVNLFINLNFKDGTMGKILEMPDTITLQLDTRYRKEWIEYSALDAQLTW